MGRIIQADNDHTDDLYAGVFDDALFVNNEVAIDLPANANAPNTLDSEHTLSKQKAQEEALTDVEIEARQKAEEQAKREAEALQDQKKVEAEKEARKTAAEATRHAAAQHGSGGGSDVITALVNAPFQLAGNAVRFAGKTLAALPSLGSSLKQRLAQNPAPSPAYNAGMVNGMKAAEDRFAAAAEAIEKHANTLREKGLGTLIDHMKRHPKGGDDFIRELNPGGQLERLADQVRNTFATPEGAAALSGIHDNLTELERQAKAMSRIQAKIGEEPTIDVAATLERVRKTTEDIPTPDNDGKFKRLQDEIKALAERIIEMFRQLFQRRQP